MDQERERCRERRETADTPERHSARRCDARINGETRQNNNTTLGDCRWSAHLKSVGFHQTGATASSPHGDVRSPILWKVFHLEDFVWCNRDRGRDGEKHTPATRTKEDEEDRERGREIVRDGEGERESVRDGEIEMERSTDRHREMKKVRANSPRNSRIHIISTTRLNPTLHCKTQRTLLESSPHGLRCLAHGILHPRRYRRRENQRVGNARRVGVVARVLKLAAAVEVVKAAVTRPELLH